MIRGHAEIRHYKSAAFVRGNSHRPAATGRIFRRVTSQAKKVLRRPKLRSPQHRAGQGPWAARGTLAHRRVYFHSDGFHRVGLPRVPCHRLTAGGAHRRRAGPFPHRGFYPHCVCHNGGRGRFLYHQSQLARGRIGVFQNGDRHRRFPPCPEVPVAPYCLGGRGNHRLAALGALPQDGQAHRRNGNRFPPCQRRTRPTQPRGTPIGCRFDGSR